MKTYLMGMEGYDRAMERRCSWQRERMTELEQILCACDNIIIYDYTVPTFENCLKSF